MRLALVVATLSLALVLGTAFRVDSMRHKHGFHVDEWWSYVTASGHLGQFGSLDGTSLYGRWVPAATWKGQWRPVSTFGFAQIARQLGAHDVHPPLYFWALHVWMLVFGVDFWSGPLLNLLVDILTGAALFGLGRRLLRDPLGAALVVLIWAVSPTVRLTSSMTRMYPMLALFAVLFVWMLVRAVDDHPVGASRGRLGPLVLLSLVTLGGMATQYQFVLIAAGGALYAIWRLIRVDRRQCLRTLASIAVGVALVVVVEPGIVGQFRLESQKAGEHFSFGALINKTNGVVDTTFGFFGLDKDRLKQAIAGPVRLGGLLPQHRLSPLVFLLGWGVLALVVALAVPRSRAWLARRERGGLIALLYLAWIGGTIVAQNLLFRSQPAVLSARYLAAAWPFVAFIPVLLGRALLPKARYVVPAVFCLAYLVPASIAPVNSVATMGPMPALQSARRAVIETTMPSTVPIALWYVPDQTPVYVDGGSALASSLPQWYPPLATGDFFVRRLSGDNRGWQELHRLRVLVPVPGRSGGMQVYRIGPPRQ